MNNQNQIIEVNAREPTPDELFYAEVGKDLLKGSSETATASARQFITLNTFLLGGSFFFFKEVPCNLVVLGLAMIFFAVSLVCSLCASAPGWGRIDALDPYEVKAFCDQTLARKLNCLKGACLAFGAGLVIAAVAVLVPG
jgi:hypothetical protein